jgi:murein DD-endopeptidase MepM/ murein hydrolase activator NlpD
LHFSFIGKASTRPATETYDHLQWARFIGAAVLVSLIAASGPGWASVDVDRPLHRRPAQAPAAAAMALLTAPAPVVSAQARPAGPVLGADVDGDGRGDFINPTGGRERSHDNYGFGAFAASRDGGERRHEGVDYVSRPGQAVVEPMSGYVTRLGYAYSDDSGLRSIEITNPALNYVARVLYVSPDVKLGQAVRLGQPLGKAQSLQKKYPGGMTNHVHVQIAPEGRAWVNCEQLIPTVRG